MTRRVLVVCTANVCRSPVGAALLGARLDGAIDADGDQWVVTSAGTADVAASIDPHTVAALDAYGADIRDHRRRRIDRTLLASDGADLVVTMTREHLRAVIAVDPAARPRTFTLKELSRRVDAVGPPDPGEGVTAWLRRLGAGRRAADMIGPDPADDVEDPYGGPARAHVAMVAEVARHVDAVVRSGPWRTPAEPAAVGAVDP